MPEHVASAAPQIPHLNTKRKVRQEKRENNNEEKNRQIAPISWYKPNYGKLPMKSYK